MRASLLCFFALCLLIEHSQVKGDETAVKVCGREFIRAVIYTCGSSRWRRHVAGPAQDLLTERSLFYSVGNRDAFDSPNVNFQEAEGNEDLKDTESGGSLRKRRKTPVQERRDLSHLLMSSCCHSGCSKKDLSTFC